MERIGTYEWTVVILGMGTVFIALIGLSFILSGFSLVARLRKGKAAAREETDSAAEPEAPAPTAPISGVSPELVAVLTAAVAAVRGGEKTDFRIARITPTSSGISGLNTPVWGYANRLTSSRR